MRVVLYLNPILSSNISGISTAFRNYERMLRISRISRSGIGDEADIFHAHFPEPVTYILSKYFKGKGVKTVITAHTTMYDMKNSIVMSNRLSPLAWRAVKKTYLEFDHVIAPSEYAKKWLERHGVGVDMVLSNGIDVMKFSSASEKKFVRRYAARGFVLSVGHIFKRKGIDVFHSVARRNPDKMFVWIGRVFKGLYSGADKYYNNPPANLRYLTDVDDIAPAYKAARVFLFPSRTETQGLVVLEAAAAGLPMVIRDLPTYDWLEHGRDCFKARNVREFSEYLNILWEDEKTARVFARRARRKVERHDIRNTAKQLKKFYAEILES